MVRPLVGGQTVPRTEVCLRTLTQPQGLYRCVEAGVGRTMSVVERRYPLRRRSSIQRVIPRCFAARVLLPSVRSRTA